MPCDVLTPQVFGGAYILFIQSIGKCLYRGIRDDKYPKKRRKELKMESLLMTMFCTAKTLPKQTLEHEVTNFLVYQMCKWVLPLILLLYPNKQINNTKLTQVKNLCKSSWTNSDPASDTIRFLHILIHIIS